MNSKRKLIIGVLAFLVVMTMGYALFSETVTIGGTAKADGNLSLDLYNPDGTGSLDIKVNGVGSSGTAKIDPSRKTLTVTANFDYPTAYIEIPVKIKNTGDIDLYVDVNIEGTVVAPNGDKADLKEMLLQSSSYDDLFELFIYEGINKHDLIKAKTEKNIIIRSKWIEDEFESEKQIKSINFNLIIDGVQELNEIYTDEPISPYKYAVGTDICLISDTDCFNIIKDNGNSVTMLARYNLTTDGQNQDAINHLVAFANKNYDKKPSDLYGYWTDDTGDLLPEYGSNYPANIYNNKSNTFNIVENYVSKLKELIHIPKDDKTLLTGRLIYFSELKELGCPSYGYCTNEEYKSWLFRKQPFWAGSAYDHYSVINLD